MGRNGDRVEPLALSPFLSLSAMASRTASPLDSQRVSALIEDPSFNAEPVSDKISAYYSLVFPNFTYYLQTLNVTIGRRCIPTSTASSSDQTQVDVDLGPLKSVSRLHARIEYEEEEERFVLAVLGRNGAWVDGAWCGKGNKVPLSERYFPSCLHECRVLLTHVQFADPDSLAHVPLCASTPAGSRGFSIPQSPTVPRAATISIGRHHISIASLPASLRIASSRSHLSPTA